MQNLIGKVRIPWFIIVMVVFLGSLSLSYAQDPSLPSPAQPVSQTSDQSFESLVYKVNIPAEIGTVDDRWDGKSSQMLFLIQDAHVSLEVQLNIARIIDILVNEYGVEMVNIEGADKGPVDFKELRELEPRDVVERVSVEFLKDCRINGAVYAKINNKKDFLQYGTEDKDMYLENYKRYLAVVEKNAVPMKFLNGVRNTMMKKKRDMLSPDLVEIINTDILFKDNDINMVAYFKLILKYAQKLNIDLIDYASVSQLLEVVMSKDAEEKFKSVDSEKLLDELKQINAEVKAKLAVNEREKNFILLLDRILLLRDMMMLKVVPDDYARYLSDKADYQPGAIETLVGAVLPGFDCAGVEGLPSLLASAEEFYKKADVRSGIIFNNALDNMKKEKKTMSAIVSGGFHTEEIVALCRKNGVSYVRIMPVVSTDEETVDYAGRMLALKSELLTGEMKAADPAAAAAPQQ